MLSIDSILTPLIQNCKLVVIEETTHVLIVDICACNPLTQSIFIDFKFLLTPLRRESG